MHPQNEVHEDHLNFLKKLIKMILNLNSPDYWVPILS